MDFKRNFPLDVLSEAQAAVQMISAGLPKQIAYQMAFSGIDDIDYVMQLIEDEDNNMPDLLDDTENEDENGGTQENETPQNTTAEAE